MDDETIKRKLEELRKNRIVLTDDRPVRANIARGTLEPAGQQEKRTRVTMDTPLAQVPKETDVARIMEERAAKARQERPIRPERIAEKKASELQKKPAGQTAEPLEEKQADEPQVQKPLQEKSEPQAGEQIAEPLEHAEPPGEVARPVKVNIARGTVDDGKPSARKLAPLPKPPRPPYGKERESFFDEMVERGEKAVKQSAEEAQEASRKAAGPEEPIALSPEEEKAEERQFADDLVSEGSREHAPEESHGHTHRQYMHGEEKPGAKATQEDEIARELLPQMKTVTALAPAGAAQREETPETLAAAHDQLTNQSRQLSRRDRRKLEEEQKGQPANAQAQGEAEPKPELTLADIIGPAGAEEKPSSLFGELEATAGEGGQPTGGEAQAAGGASLFGELEAVAGGAAAPKPTTVNVQVKKQEATACPTCKAANTRVVFCPYCGTGMCANCSPSIKTEGDLFIFTCPKCSEEVNVAKHA